MAGLTSHSLVQPFAVAGSNFERRVALKAGFVSVRSARGGDLTALQVHPLTTLQGCQDCTSAPSFGVTSTVALCRASDVGRRRVDLKTGLVRIGRCEVEDRVNYSAR